MTLMMIMIFALLQATGGTSGRAADVLMTGGGWVFMIAAFVFILTLVYYTFSKVLRGGGK